MSTKAFGCFALLCSFILLWTGFAAARSVRNGKIAFVRVFDRHSEINTINPDGSELTRLTFYDGFDLFPAWSPSGRSIAFVRNTSSRSDIYLMNANGSNQRIIPNSEMTGGPISWSPNGQKLAFSNSGDIFTINVDGTGRTNLTNGTIRDPLGYGAAIEPSWSPDGSKIAFTGPGHYHNIWVMNADGSAAHPITDSFFYTSVGSPSWSPTGDKIVYSDASQALIDNDILSVIGVDGYGRSTIFTSSGNGFGTPYSPSFSPDGQDLIFSLCDGDLGDQCSTIHIASLNKGPLRVPDGQNISPSWQRQPASSQFDFDGDGRADISQFRPSSGTWLLSQSSGGFRAMNWGVDTDKLVPADYDGDGKTDIVVWRPADGRWYFFGSATNSFYTRSWGEEGDIPAPGDFDGDGRADLNVFRPSTGLWYRINSSSNSIVVTSYGQLGDRPVIGDYDGDGEDDLAVFRPKNSTWYLQRSSAGYAPFLFASGPAEIVPADYDGDGRTDMAFVDTAAGIWSIYDWKTGSLATKTFGQAGDIPAPADYDGDGAADLAVFRPSDNTWRFSLSSGGATTVAFGADGDHPIPGAY